MSGQENIRFIWHLFKSFPDRFVMYGVTIESPIESPMVSSTILNSSGRRVQDQPYRGYLYPPKTNYISKSPWPGTTHRQHEKYNRKCNIRRIVYHPVGHTRQLAVFLSKRMLAWMIKTSIVSIPMNRPWWPDHHRQQQLLYLISWPCHQVYFPRVRPPHLSMTIALHGIGTPIPVHFCPLASRMCIHCSSLVL